MELAFSLAICIETETLKRKWVIQEIAQTCGISRSILIADKVIAFAELVNDLRSRSLLDSASPLGAQSRNDALLSNLARYRNTLSSDPMITSMLWQG